MFSVLWTSPDHTEQTKNPRQVFVLPSAGCILRFIIWLAFEGQVWNRNLQGLASCWKASNDRFNLFHQFELRDHSLKIGSIKVCHKYRSFATWFWSPDIIGCGCSFSLLVLHSSSWVTSIQRRESRWGKTRKNCRLAPGGWHLLRDSSWGNSDYSWQVYHKQLLRPCQGAWPL